MINPKSSLEETNNYYLCVERCVWEHQLCQLLLAQHGIGPCRGIFFTH